MQEYEDIIHLEHPTSRKHPRMPVADRAAQFSPFAALTGHDVAIRETGRLTDSQLELGEDEKKRIDEKLQHIRAHLSSRKKYTIFYFLPDEKKDGGAYVAHAGEIKRIDEYEQMLILEDGKRIPLERIRDIEEF